MYVKKRSGELEKVGFDKITRRIEKLTKGLNPLIDSAKVAKKVIDGIYDGVSTQELDTLAAETAAMMTTIHPDYTQLASRISVSNLHKNTKNSFTVKMSDLFNYVDQKTGEAAPLISQETMDIVKKHSKILNETINYENDFNYDYFGFKTLEKSYLFKLNGKIAERPQDMLMRVSIGIHGDDIEEVLETYQMMSQKLFTHATPTLFNAGTPKPQMSSCFLLVMADDSIDGIFDTLKQTALISKSAGGIGISAHNVRASGSYIRGTNGVSNGIVPMLRVFNETARYVDQGGGKRKGSFAIYMEPWHADIFDFLDLRKNTGKEEMRARDLFLGMWIPDLFMERVEADGLWTLMCPNECPNLHEVYGDEFKVLYESYEAQNKGRKTIKARELWEKILESQIETGTPYMLYKDACNKKSNQKNLGTIKSSNLCTEIIEYTSPDEVAVCNLASISLPMFVKNGVFDHNALYKVTRKITRNLNCVIDRNFYPVIEARNSNMRHRPIALGVQGLADAFILLRLPFTSDEAKLLNKEIFETIYFAALEESCDLAIKHGHYESFKGSPASEGILQFDMWGVNESELSGRWDWKTLKENIVEYGIRNSLLMAPMPTASTSSILGNNECFEPYTSNMYVRRVLAGEFIMINHHLLKDLIKLDLWNDEMKQTLMKTNGSVQNISEIPQDIKDLYLTAWEMKMRDILDMSRDRGYFIDQSQSLNLFMTDITIGKLTSMLFYGWKLGLKTGLYYLRGLAAVDAVKATIINDKKPKAIEIEPMSPEELREILKRSQNLDDGEECIACGS